MVLKNKKKIHQYILLPIVACLTFLSLMFPMRWSTSSVHAQEEKPHSEEHNPVDFENVVFFDELQLNQEALSDLLLPDLRTLPPYDLRLEIDQHNGIRLLRFANTIWNSGSGALELHGERPRGAENVNVSQLIEREDDSEFYYDAGQFHYHIEHGHWHWENFSLYQVWTVAPDGRLLNLVAYADKVGYCLFDVSRYRGLLAANLDTPLYREYLTCNPVRQGLSVGWTDTYRAHLPGQYVDVSQLPNGMYALRSVVDPGGLILEENYSNNSAVVYFILQEDRVMHLDDLPDHIGPASSPF
jgi:hypothetical protein